MTNYKQVRTNGKRGANIKEDQPPCQTKRQRQAASDKFQVAGFAQIDWNKWSYSWAGGKFPVFVISPGTHADDQGSIHAGLIARCEGVEKEILFAYGTDPAVIKVRLDDEIAALTEIGEMLDFDGWLADLPKTNPPVNTRPGAEYGVWV